MSMGGLYFFNRGGRDVWIYIDKEMANANAR